MNDLFTRLSQRAIGEGGLVVHAQHGPPSDLDNDEAATDPAETSEPQIERAPSADARDPGPPVAEPIALPIPAPKEHGAEQPLSARLAPMPVIIPPSVTTPVARSPIGATPPVTGMTTSWPAPRAVAAVDSIPAELEERPLPVRVVRPPALEPPPAPPGPAAVSESTRERSMTFDGRPVVEVTVGRIEVRVRPPVPPAADRARRPGGPAPALTLEEYLNRRGGGS